MLLPQINFIILIFKAIFVHSKLLQLCSETSKFYGIKCDKTLLPRHAVQASRDIICYIDTKIINFYFIETNPSPVVANLLMEIHRCMTGAINTYTYNGAIKVNLNEVDPILQVLTLPNTTSETIKFCLKNIQKFSANKKYKKYLLVFEKITDKSENLYEKWLFETFQIMWNRNILNVIVMFYQHKKINLYTYNPFNKENYFIKLNAREFKDLFNQNIGNLYKQEIVVSMFANGVRSYEKLGHGFDGVDGNVASLLEEKLNATFIYSSKTKTLNYSSLNEDTADVIHSRTNISMNSRWLLKEDFLENTNSYERDNLCVIVPKGKQIPSFYNLFFTMQYETWIVAIIFVFIITIVYLIIQLLNTRIARNYDDEELHLTTIQIIFYMLQAFFGDSLTKLPKAPPLRLIFITWLCYSLIISSAFTGTLISKIAIPLYEKDIDTIDELKETGMDILIPDYFYEKSHIWDNETYEKLKPQFKILNITIFNDHFTRNTTGMAYALSDSLADFEIARRVDKKIGRPLYHKMQDCLIYFPRGYIATIGSPYIGMMNDLLGRFVEAGFNNYWQNMAEFQARIKGIISDNDENDDDSEQDDNEIKVILSVRHLESAFYLLSIGIVLSTMVFIGELINYYYHEKRKNQIIYLTKNLSIKQNYMTQLKNKFK